ncbi:MAG: penicillin-insensitive murein endopeptidase [Alphaproteobacteria bacterium]
MANFNQNSASSSARQLAWWVAAMLLLGASGVAAQTPAKNLFGAKALPASLAPAAYGFYTKGCLAGAEPLTFNGKFHQAMRLERNRFWAHPAMIEYINKLSNRAAKAGWPGLLVGDMSQPRGGPMLTGHASHQIGLDADIWLTPMPARRLTKQERASMSAISIRAKNRKTVDAKVWTKKHFYLLRAAASFSEVARIFVNPVIKKKLCQSAGSDRGWLRKIRPWRGHHFHFHVRLSCPSGVANCRDQPAPAAGDGCGADLARWFKPPPKTTGKKKGHKHKKPPLVLADLPQQCRAVLDAN